MLIIPIALVILGIIAFLVMHFSSKGENNSKDEVILPEEGCCGAHEICEVDLKRKLSEEIIYFEDEELDAFREIAENNYQDDAIEQFREVLYTLKKKEINDWLHSLELRKIALPDILKPEVIMLLSE